MGESRGEVGGMNIGNERVQRWDERKVGFGSKDFIEVRKW
jgi:hypothetical protein